MRSVINQLWLDTEIAEGTPIVLTAADALYAEAPTGDIDRDEFTENRSQRTLSRAPTIIGQSRMKFTFGLDLKGSGLTGGVPNVPELHKPLIACSFRSTQMYRNVPGVIVNGPIHHGATYSQAGSGSVGYIIGQYVSSAARLHYMPTNGIAMDNTGLVTVNDNPTWFPGPYTEKEFTPSANTAHGYAYQPVTEVWSVATRGVWTGTPTVGEAVRGSTSLAVGQLLGNTLPLGGAGSVYVEVVLGTFVAETITGLSSGATCVISGSPPFALLYNTSATIAFYKDGMRFLGTGCRGTFKAPLESGKPCLVNFEFEGLESAVDTVPSPTGAVYDEVTAPRFVNADWTLDGLGIPISQLEIDIANAKTQRPSPNYPEGAISFETNARDPVVRLDPEMMVPAVYDYFAKWRASTLVAAKFRLGATETGIADATTIGRIVWVDMPKIQYRRVPLGDRNGRVIGNVEGGLRQGTTAGNDELVFYFL